MTRRGEVATHTFFLANDPVVASFYTHRLHIASTEAQQSIDSIKRERQQDFGFQHDNCNELQRAARALNVLLSVLSLARRWQYGRDAIIQYSRLYFFHITTSLLARIECVASTTVDIYSLLFSSLFNDHKEKSVQSIQSL